MPHPDARPHPMRSLLILSMSALAFSLAQTMLIPALGELTTQLDTDASGIAWVLTGYHWIFWLGAISAALAAIATQLWVPESPERKPGRVDLRGAALLGLGLVLPLLAISRANNWGWGSTRTLVLIAARASAASSRSRSGPRP